MGKLTLMLTGCRTWIQVIQVEGGWLRLEAWGLMCPSLTDRAMVTGWESSLILKEAGRTKNFEGFIFPWVLPHPCILLFKTAWALHFWQSSWEGLPVGMSFSLLSHYLLRLNFWVFEFDIHPLAFHDHHRGKDGSNLRLPGDNSAELGQGVEMDRCPKLAGQGAGIFSYWIITCVYSLRLCPCTLNLCRYMCGRVSLVIVFLWKGVCVCVCVCVCVYFQSTAGAEMKATGYETWSNKKRNY